MSTPIPTALEIRAAIQLVDQARALVGDEVLAEQLAHLPTFINVFARLTADKFSSALYEYKFKRLPGPGKLVAYACGQSLECLAANLFKMAGGEVVPGRAPTMDSFMGIELRADEGLSLGSLLFRREDAAGKAITPMEPVSVEAPITDLGAHWNSLLDRRVAQGERLSVEVKTCPEAMQALKEAAEQATAAIKRVKDAQAELIRTIEVFGANGVRV